MVTQAQPHQAEVLQGAEHDTEEQWRFERIKKRRPKDSSDEEGEVRQGVLF